MLKKLTKNTENGSTINERRANDLIGRCMAICISSTCYSWETYDQMHASNHEGYYSNM